VPQTQKV